MFADHAFPDDPIILLDLLTLFIDLRAERIDGRIKAGDALFFQRDLRVQLLHERILLLCQRRDLIDVIADIFDLLLQIADLLLYRLLAGGIFVLELCAQIGIFLGRLDRGTFSDPVFLIREILCVKLHRRDASGQQKSRRDAGHDPSSVHHRFLSSFFCKKIIVPIIDGFRQNEQISSSELL